VICSLATPESNNQIGPMFSVVLGDLNEGGSAPSSCSASCCMVHGLLGGTRSNAMKCKPAVPRSADSSLTPLVTIQAKRCGHVDELILSTDCRD
jgi:hypothetical protein